MTNKATVKKNLIFDEYIVDTPPGTVYVWLCADGVLQAIGWSQLKEKTLNLLKRAYNAEIEIKKATNKHKVIKILEDYFAGDIEAIDHLEVADIGTEFQKKVWQALRKIPVGTTTSYGEIAKQVGNPLASRAVGMANNQNPIAIVVPCHRVIGKNKKLTGYAGGLEFKEWLLNHEQQHFCHKLN